MQPQAAVECQRVLGLQQQPGIAEHPNKFSLIKELLADALDDRNVPDEVLKEWLAQEERLIVDQAANNARSASLDVYLGMH